MGQECPKSATDTAGTHPVWGEAVRALRSINRLSVAELASRAALTADHVARIEAGDRTLSPAAAVRLARALRVDPQLAFPDDAEVRS